jgi:hypothetical protein
LAVQAHAAEEHTLWAMAERLLGTELAENEHFLDTNMLFKK